ncbi:MAG: iron-containing alcohol dehydrogenase, partial [Anaerolineales bacterium]|nr:iron-containing alcohol dehydrogenase [Anaerolineales bacterium]
MQPFSFQVPTKVVFGAGSVKDVSSEVEALNAKHVMIVTDPGIVKAGLVDKVTGPLCAAGIAYSIFDDIEPNPKTTTILRGAEVMKEAQSNVVVALGGGSPLDAAKAVAVMAVNEGPIEDYCGAGADPWPVAPPPIIGIPTTAGTG